MNAFIKFNTSVLSALLAFAHVPSSVSASEGAVARCGASKGTSYYFYDEIMNPKGPEWSEDGISDGKLILISLGDEWDIQFDDVAGAFGYRQDGAEVIPLGSTENKLTIGAFRGTYTDVYTFDLTQKEVVWSSHKIGTPIPKVAIYRAPCSFVAAGFLEALQN